MLPFVKPITRTLPSRGQNLTHDGVFDRKKLLSGLSLRRSNMHKSPSSPTVTIIESVG